MTAIGRIDSLWRYPVKSMRGEELAEAYVGFAGVYGDRLYAIRNATAPAGFPFLTARELEEMLLCRPRFRFPERAARPPNQAEAEALGPGLTTIYGDAQDLALDVELPSGEVLGIDDPALLRTLGERSQRPDRLTLLRSDRALTDCRPLSLFSLQTAAQLGQEVGATVDKRRFRANLYLDLLDQQGFAEDGLVGKRLKIGDKVEIAVLERDPRCKMITLDPDTAAQSQELIRTVTRAHDGMAGVYAAVLVEGSVRSGDPSQLSTDLGDLEQDEAPGRRALGSAASRQPADRSCPGGVAARRAMPSRWEDE